MKFTTPTVAPPTTVYHRLQKEVRKPLTVPTLIHMNTLYLSEAHACPTIMAPEPRCRSTAPPTIVVCCKRRMLDSMAGFTATKFCFCWSFPYPRILCSKILLRFTYCDSKRVPGFSTGITATSFSTLRSHYIASSSRSPLVSHLPILIITHLPTRTGNPRTPCLVDMNLVCVVRRSGIVVHQNVHMVFSTSIL